MLHRHEHDKQLREADRERLISEGVTAQGMIHRSELSADDRLRSQVRVEVRFKDGQEVEFAEELANLYQPAPGSQEAARVAEARGAEQLRHPGRIPKIQLPLSVGERVPVRYDAADRTKIVLDVPALQQRTLRDYIRRESGQMQQKPATAAARSGPPWALPAHCPNCGAPVDQAKASHDPDPLCQFCSQPLPVSRLTPS
jgi:hypothetical protein